MSTTNWFSVAMNLDQFDDLGGTRILDSVTFVYGGTVDSHIKVESHDASATTVTGTSAAMLMFGGPVSQNLLISNSASVGLTAYDGVVDWGGTSGYDFGSIIATDSGSITFNSGLASYIGTGTYNVLATAIGSSSGSGAGNLDTNISTQAAANIAVTYTYHDNTTQVPEPATLGLLGLGLLGLGAMRRKRA